MIDTTGWPTLDRLQMDKRHNRRTNTRSHALVRSAAGKWIPVVPVPDNGDTCKHCVGNEDAGPSWVKCHQLPACTDMVYVKATPENVAQYMAERMTHGD